MSIAKSFRSNWPWIVGAILVLGLLYFTFGRQANAADRPNSPVPAPVVRVAAEPPFSGAYVGVQGGWGQYDASDRSALPGLAPAIYDGKFKGDGWFAGVQAGFDHQIGMIVVGGVADYSWARLDGSKQIAIPAGPGITIDVPHKIERFGTVRARAGIALDHLLIYGTGGLAYAETNTDLDVGVTGMGNVFSTSADTNRIGWAYGAGAEWKFLENWSASIEYLRLDLGTANVAFSTPFGGIVAGVPVKMQADVVKAGLNYRF